MNRLLIAAATAILLTTAAHAESDGSCAIIRPQPDGWLAVRIGPGTQHRLIRKLLPGREVTVERKHGDWHFISTWVTKNGTTEEVRGFMYGPYLRPVECEDGCQ